MPYVAFKLLSEFQELMASELESASWVATSSEWRNLDLADHEFIDQPIQASMIPIIHALYSVALGCRTLGVDLQRDVAKHVAQRLPKVKKEDIPKLEEVLSDSFEPKSIGFGQFLSAVYEANCYCMLNRQGVRCKFEPESKLNKTPDISCVNYKVLIECKDASSDVALKNEPKDIIRKIQFLIEDAETHFPKFDPIREYEHVICIDMPEGTVRRLQMMSTSEREQFARDLFNIPFIGQDRRIVERETLIDNPRRVILSDFDNGRFRNKEKWKGREGLWLLPLFQCPSTIELEAFLERVYRAPHKPKRIGEWER